MNIEDIKKPENLVYSKTPLLTDAVMHYCPGCSHGVVHKLVAEVIEEMGIQDKTVGISPVGCSVFAYNYIDIDWQQAAHGRAPALATAVKRLNPEKYVFTYQGDGDLCSIGTAEIIHACARGENILVIFINNGIYGMTGGQMAPTTLLGMKTSTTPYGRDAKLNGFPMVIAPMIAELDGTAYITRQSVHTAAAARKAKGWNTAQKEWGSLLWKLLRHAIPDGSFPLWKPTDGWWRTCSRNIRLETSRMS